MAPRIYGWYIQHYMSVFPILCPTKTWSKFLTFMLALLFQISIFDFLYDKNWSFVYDIIWWEVVWSNFRISRPERDIIDKYHLLWYNFHSLILTNKRSYVVNIRHFHFSDEYKKYKADITCQLHHFNLEKSFIPQQHDQNFRYLC